MEATTRCTIFCRRDICRRHRNLFDWVPLNIRRPPSPLEDQAYGLLRKIMIFWRYMQNCNESLCCREFLCPLCWYGLVRRLLALLARAFSFMAGILWHELVLTRCFQRFVAVQFVAVFGGWRSYRLKPGFGMVLGWLRRGQSLV